MDNNFDNTLDNSNEEKLIDPAAIKVWRIGGLIGSIVFLAIGITINIFVKWWWTLIPIILLGIIFIFISPAIEYKQWKYLISQRYVKFSHGIYFTTTTNIPINKIQHIDISESPIQKIYKLASVQLYTAGSSHTIECISKSEADKIVEYLNGIILGEELNGHN